MQQNSVDNDELVKVTKFNTLGHDERGLTAEFSLPRKQNEYVFLTRKKGSLSGNAYHVGKSTSTRPKTFVLLTGSILFSYRKIGSTQKNSVLIDAPALIEVAPYVTHNVQALSDSTFLECNSIKDIQNDRIKEDV